MAKKQKKEKGNQQQNPIKDMPLEEILRRGLRVPPPKKKKWGQ